VTVNFQLTIIQVPYNQVISVNNKTWVTSSWKYKIRIYSTYTT